MGTQANMPDNPEIWKAAAMADHFEKIQKLPDPVVGCPNFRRIPGYKVYCCGQPTAEGFKNCLEKVCGTIYPKDGKIIWLNMRQEPNVYVNGTPICARPPNKIGEYAELGAVTTAALNADEPEFMRVVEGRMKENADKLKYVDISKKEHEIEVKDLKTLDNVIEGLKESFPGLVHLRVPVCNSAAPSIADFDTICENLVGTGINTPIIINDQVGLSRATTACVIACLFKEFQINASFEGLVETVPGVNLDLLKMDKYTMDPSKDPLFRGEFPVVLALLEKLKGGKEAKNECDKVIDKNGTPKTGCNGIKQLRENIAEPKLSYEIMDDAAQAFLKVKIMDNIHKYYYMIAFTAYMREMAEAARGLVSDEQKAALTLPGGKSAIPGNQLGNVIRDSVKADELEFQKVVEGRAKENGGKLKYFTISKEEKEVEVKDLKTLSDGVEGLKADFPGLVHMRVPVCNSAAPNEADFDIICNTLVGTSINTPIIVNDQPELRG